MRIGEANVSASSLIDAHTARLHRALSCAVFDATSWRAPRSGGRRAPKGLIPFGNPQCEKVAPLSLCSSFRKMIHLQTLRARVQKTRAHFRARPLALPVCRSCWQNLEHGNSGVYVYLVLCCVERQCRGFPGGTPGHVSWLLLGVCQEVTQSASAPRCGAHNRRSSCLKFRYTQQKQNEHPHGCSFCFCSNSLILASSRAISCATGSGM